MAEAQCGEELGLLGLVIKDLRLRLTRTELGLKHNRRVFYVDSWYANMTLDNASLFLGWRNGVS